MSIGLCHVKLVELTWKSNHQSVLSMSTSKLALQHIVNLSDVVTVHGVKTTYMFDP